MKTINTLEIYEKLKKVISSAVCDIDDGVKALLVKAYENEPPANVAAKCALTALIENFELSKKNNIPACQDTGMAVIFLDIGQDIAFSGRYIEDVVDDAVRDAYKEGPFRASVLDPITRVNTRDNTPAIINTRIVKGDGLKIGFLAKGFGSENMSKIYMLTPSDGVAGIIDCAVKTVCEAGGKPCPPIIVGVGIGGDFEKCALLSKRALLRRAGAPHPDKAVADIENKILNSINALNIGAQGFGGVTTALSVAIETFATHIAGLPVAVNIQCHSVRHGEIVL
jgi:fumarate hydratase subunit alpha